MSVGCRLTAAERRDFSRVPCFTRGKDELGVGKTGKVSVAVWADGSLEGRRGVWEDGRFGRRRVMGRCRGLQCPPHGSRGTVPSAARAPGKRQLCPLTTPMGSARLQRLL